MPCRSTSMMSLMPAASGAVVEMMAPQALRTSRPMPGATSIWTGRVWRSQEPRGGWTAGAGKGPILLGSRTYAKTRLGLIRKNRSTSSGRNRRSPLGPMRYGFSSPCWAHRLTVLGCTFSRPATWSTVISSGAGT